MSTSLLYHAFGVVGYQYVSTSFEGGWLTFGIEKPREHFRCSHCDSDNVWGQGREERFFQTVPIGGKPVLLQLAVPRVYCGDCGLTRQLKLGFADPRRKYTRSFERYALDLSRSMTIQDVALHLQVSWDIIKDIQARSLEHRFGKPKLKHLKQLAIDEICIGKGHRYLTVVLDLLSGAVVFVGDGKGAAALEPFWRRLRHSHAKIQAVATDMSAAYTLAIRENLPRAVHVFDHFHVIKLYNDKLSNFRRELYHELNAMDRRVLKGIRWLLLKNPENLDPERDEAQRLEDALSLNKALAIVYYMKEYLRHLWSLESKTEARALLKDWLQLARASDIRMLHQFADSLEEHQRGILAYYDYPISTGPLEGTNNKIRVLNRQAYGFRDLAFLKLKILALHQSKHALVG
jgi:transposase